MSEARWVFLPVLGAAAVHAPVLRFDLAPALRRPLDGGASWRGKRLLGDNKTWRGALVIAGGAFVTAAALHRARWYRERLPEPLQRANPAAFGAALALGTVGAELPNSFLKRRLGVAPGNQRRDALGLALTVLDQGDVVLGCRLTLRPLWRMGARDTADAFATFAAVHMVVNVAGYALGARDSAI